MKMSIKIGFGRVRAPPALHQGRTKPEPKHKLKQVLGLSTGHSGRSRNGKTYLFLAKCHVTIHLD